MCNWDKRLVLRQRGEPEPGRQSCDGALRRWLGPSLGLQDVRTLSFGDSEAEPFLRACDYLLAACVDFTRRAISGDEIPVEIREAAHHGLGRMLTQAAGLGQGSADLEFQIGGIMAADRWIGSVAKPFLPR